MTDQQATLPACPACHSPCVSSYPQCGGEVTVYRFACGRRDRHWGSGNVGTINGGVPSCKYIAALHTALMDIAADERPNHEHYDDPADCAHCRSYLLLGLETREEQGQ